MADDSEIARINIVAEALQNVFEDQVTDDSEPEFWKLRAAEVIEQLEMEGIFLE